LSSLARAGREAPAEPPARERKLEGARKQEAAGIFLRAGEAGAENGRRNRSILARSLFWISTVSIIKVLVFHSRPEMWGAMPSLQCGSLTLSLPADTLVDRSKGK
jgi:hypothetical protein